MARKISWGKLIKRLSPYNIKKGILYLKHYGPREFASRLGERFENTDIDYNEWYMSQVPDENELERQRKHSLEFSLKISLAVPLYNTPEKFLRQLIECVQLQTYTNWELCLADGSPDTEQGAGVREIVLEYSGRDGRIKYRRLEKNLGIAGNTNAAFEMADGDFVALLDHDDLLAPSAVYEVVKALQEHPGADAVYTDEDKVDTELTEHFQPHFKPDFSPDLLRANNYICHWFVVKKTLLEEVGGLRSEFDGAQDYDFIFRCTEKAGEVVHVPKILYHWRVHKASTADNPASKMYAFEAGKRAIESHLDRCGLPGEVSHTPDYGFYRVKYTVKGTPLVSVVIPNKDHVDTLRQCLRSVREKTTYPRYEIIIVENNSVEDETFELYRSLEAQENIRVVRWESGFNYSAINNYGFSEAKGEYIICLNNDITVITPDWMEELLGHCQRPDTGIVGARLYYPDDTIQHAGIVIGIGGIAGSLFVNMPRSRSGYLHKARLQQDLSAVTAACMMVKRSVWEEAGGFEEKLAVAFNDVDFCLRVRKAGYLVVYDPYVEMYHDESKTRGVEDTKEKVRRFQSEIEYMRGHWINILKNGDPYYNPNLSLTSWNYELRNLE